MLREYIVSEAMHALGIPTTRSLAAVITGERVIRDDILPGAVLTRVASSHIRVGTFQFFAARGDTEGVKLLLDHVIARHYPEAAGAARPALAVFEAVVAHQAALVARWLCVGFIHGVMNTDNTSICGETIDYGPCAFMDAYHPATVFSSIDEGGRYAYGNQPRIAQWNLARLAETLLPFLADDEDSAVKVAEEALGRFPAHFEAAYLAGLRAKLGLTTVREEDPKLAGDLLRAMADQEADFTLVFRRLADAAADPAADAAVAALFRDPAPFSDWAVRWRERLSAETVDPASRRAAMRAVNPAFIPRNHRVEAAIAAAVERDDFGPFEDLVTVLARPYEDQPGFAAWMDPPQPSERVLRTFCGT